MSCRRISLNFEKLRCNGFNNYNNYNSDEYFYDMDHHYTWELTNLKNLDVIKIGNFKRKCLYLVTFEK